MEDPCEPIRQRAIEEHDEFGRLVSSGLRNMIVGAIGVVISLGLAGVVHPIFIVAAIISVIVCANGVSQNEQGQLAREREMTFMKQYRECQDRERQKRSK